MTTELLPADQQSTPTPEASPTGSPSPASSRGSRVFVVLFLLVLAAGLGVLIYNGIGTRVSAESLLVKETHESTALDVAITHPKQVGGAQEVILPGNTQPFIDAPIYARTSGYLRKWYADIGARVHKGDLLAEIDSPEVDAQLLQAKATLATANANLQFAQIEGTRWQGLIKTNAVSQDELDQKVGTLNADKAIVAADEASVKNLEELVSFEKVMAPFDGVVTARKTDVGALINAGVGTAAPELFHMTEISQLRVFVNVPEQDIRAAQSGATATLFLGEFPGRTFSGKIVRNSNAIDPTSRTLLVEVDVDNPTGELLPGAYVAVHFKLPGASNAMTVPANTLLFRTEGLRVAVVRDNKAQLIPVHVGRDFGDSLEVTDGLKLTDVLIINPPDSLISGAPVRVLPGN
jgi:RND family efflux transporter MFP subunit